MKFPHSRYFEIRVFEAMIDFDAADAQSNPKLYVSTDWEATKEFFKATAIRLGEKNFEGK